MSGSSGGSACMSSTLVAPTSAPMIVDSSLCDAVVQVSAHPLPWNFLARARLWSEIPELGNVIGVPFCGLDRFQAFLLPLWSTVSQKCHFSDILLFCLCKDSNNIRSPGPMTGETSVVLLW